MTEPATTTDPTDEEIAAAEEARVNALAVAEIHGDIYSDVPLRMTQDAYVGVVGTGRRALKGEASAADVQAQLDAVFGPGKVSAGDVLQPPGGPVVAEAEAEPAKSTRSK